MVVKCGGAVEKLLRSLQGASFQSITVKRTRMKTWPKGQLQVVINKMRMVMLRETKT